MSKTTGLPSLVFLKFGLYATSLTKGNCVVKLNFPVCSGLFRTCKSQMEKVLLFQYIDITKNCRNLKMHGYFIELTSKKLLKNSLLSGLSTSLFGFAFLATSTLTASGPVTSAVQPSCWITLQQKLH